METDTPSHDRPSAELPAPGDEPVYARSEQLVSQSSAGRGAWGYWDLLYLLLFAVPAFLLIAVIAMGALYGLSCLQGWNLSLDDPQTQAPLVIAIQLVWWMCVLGFIYTVVTIKYRLPFARAIGWTPLDRPPTAYLAGGVLLAVGVAGASYFIPKPEGKLPIEKLLEDPVAMVLLAVFGVLVAPVTEELVFRGFVFPAVQRSHGTVTAILFTSLIFSLVHGMQYGWRWQNLLLLLAVGVVFGTVRGRTGSVVPSTLIHAAYNATLFAALFAAGDQITRV